MKTLYIERSTGNCRDGGWTEMLDLDGVDRIVVGTGPGSFAGIRSAIAFAQGFALGRKCEVLGLPSPCAMVATYISRHRRLAVVGDARQSKAWIALFDGFSLVREVFQVDFAELGRSVPDEYAVVTPDAKRIESQLAGAFGERYLGGDVPTAEGLRKFAEANPAVLVPDPLPLYLNPAVRN